MNQEVIALLIVTLAAGAILRSVYRRYLAPGLARWLLRKGRVGLAMKVRGRDSSGCHKH